MYFETRIVEELNEHIKDESDWSLENLKKLVYLEAVFKEAIRLYPPGPIMARTIDHEIHIKGVPIPVGTQVTITPYSIHRETKYWPDPECFLPDRFLGDAPNHRHPFSYIPFSAGSRNCIG